MYTAKLLQYLTETESLIGQANLINENVSASSVGWHLEHLLLVLQRSTKALPASVVTDYKPKRSFKKSLILFTKKIPRGVAKAPKIVRPELDNITIDKLYDRFANVKTQLSVLNEIPTDHFFSHPVFGDLKLKKAIKFLEVHTNHHLKIVREIVQATDEKTASV